MTVKDQNLIITTDYLGDITLEAVSFEQKAAFFEEIFGIGRCFAIKSMYSQV